jgi:hypothetical protein
VINTATAATRTAVTNSAGLYRITALEPSTYAVSVSATGFEWYKDADVQVTVGVYTDISPKLTIGNVSQVLAVTDQAYLLHTDSPEISTVLDQATIDNLPINGRRWSSFALLTPGVVSNSDGFCLLSFRGISYLLNNNTVDGADDNQAYFSEARGRTRASYAVSQGAVQEFQVNTSNYSAEYGRSAGGVINTVTKSGGNQLHGELFFYNRDNNFGGAVNPYTLLTTPNAAGTYVTTPYNPKDWRKQWGFGVGGPIIHDKLFWFYGYDQQQRNFPGTARASDPADTFAQANSTLPTNVQRHLRRRRIGKPARCALRWRLGVLPACRGDRFQLPDCRSLLSAGPQHHELFSGYCSAHGRSGDQFPKAGLANKRSQPFDVGVQPLALGLACGYGDPGFQLRWPRPRSATTSSRKTLASSALRPYSTAIS